MNVVGNIQERTVAFLALNALYLCVHPLNSLRRTTPWGGVVGLVGRGHAPPTEGVYFSLSSS